MARVQTCPKCRALLEPGTKVCPYCEAGQQSATAPSPEQDAVHTTKLGTWLLTINLVVFFLTVQFAMGDDRAKRFRPTAAAINAFGANHPTYTDECGQYWRLVSANFLHNDLWHLLFNSVAILILIPTAAVTLGAHRTILIYLVAGVGGFWLSMRAGLWSAGASASLCGLIGALAVYGKRRGAPELTRRMLTWAVIIAVLGLVLRDMIDNWGHAGGGLVGAALGWPASAVRARGSRGDRAWQVGAFAAVLVVVAVLAVFVVPSVVRGTERHDARVYNAEVQSLLRRLGEGRPPDTAEFKEGPGDSHALAVAVSAAITKVRGRATDAGAAVTAAEIAWRDWQHGMNCSHYLTFAGEP